ncbi:MAG: M20/M25/M40 family metallo-hydrolase, partial [Chloroflexi bacterium]|nr:M20/M25/M40 family metallo-hydrolase [Chloroflexota bacterium]
MPGSEQNKVPSAVELLQRLIRFDTSNPPGDERECALWLKALLDEHGVENRLLHPAGLPNRLNVVARVPGRGDAPPLLLQGHTDVVSVHGQRWSMDPFGGEIADGCVWGRGAVDMKGGLTMMLHTVLRAKYSENPPPGDIILA